MGLDIRLPLGLIFLITGLIMLIRCSHSRQRDVQCLDGHQH